MTQASARVEETATVVIGVVAPSSGTLAGGATASGSPREASSHLLRREALDAETGAATVPVAAPVDPRVGQRPFIREVQRSESTTTHPRPEVDHCRITSYPLVREISLTPKAEVASAIAQVLADLEAVLVGDPADAECTIVRVEAGPEDRARSGVGREYTTL